MLTLYCYVYKAEALTRKECGMKLSASFDKEVILEGSRKKCVSALISPMVDSVKFESGDFACLQLEIHPRYCLVADHDQDGGAEGKYMTDKYLESIIPFEKYTDGLYQNPEYLVTCTVSSEQIHIVNRKFFLRHSVEQNQTLVQPAGEPAAQNAARETGHNPQLGQLLLQKGIISEKQLSEAIAYQSNQGGRLGDILISLGYAEKQQLEAMIPKGAKKLRIGELLVERGHISQEQLASALDFQRKSGGRLGDILLSLNMVSTETLFRELATQNKLGRVGKLIDFKNALKLPHEIARKNNAIVVNRQRDKYLLAVAEILNEDRIKEIEAFLDMPVEQVLAAYSELDDYWNIVYSESMAEESINKLVDQQPENSAIETFTRKQVVFFAALPVLTLISYYFFGLPTLIVLNIFVQLLYFAMSVFKFRILLMGSREDSQIRIGQEALAKIDETELPIYTILVPMYKEKEVIPQLIAHIDNIDYPKFKLDVRLLLEEDDQESYEVIKSMNLPPYYTTVIVPHSLPKTKPKACNYGLIRARGEYVVIYDAEDRPDPDQLKKVFLTFKGLPEEYICVQAKLNYFNSNQNILTKWFTQEYSMWFELLLPGVMKFDIPIPLGGTSNHFKMDYLKKIIAWDPYNVTEDADLGVRIFKDGYKTAVVDSRTWEEANSQMGNWLRQRSRWIKGYMQTWLVHMRKPVKLLKELGIKGFLGFQVMVLGTPLLTLLNPFFWCLVIVWYSFKPPWLEMIFPGGIYYIALVQFAIGNFIFIFSYLLGTYWVIDEVSAAKSTNLSYSLVKYALLSPIYWLLMSIAAFKAFGQLITKPFYWEKTHHGLTKEDSADIFDNSIAG